MTVNTVSPFASSASCTRLTESVAEYLLFTVSSPSTCRAVANASAGAAACWASLAGVWAAPTPFDAAASMPDVPAPSAVVPVSWAMAIPPVIIIDTAAPASQKRIPACAAPIVFIGRPPRPSVQSFFNACRSHTVYAAAISPLQGTLPCRGACDHLIQTRHGLFMGHTGAQIGEAVSKGIIIQFLTNLPNKGRSPTRHPSAPARRASRSPRTPAAARRGQRRMDRFTALPKPLPAP